MGTREGGEDAWPSVGVEGLVLRFRFRLELKPHVVRAHTKARSRAAGP